MIRRTTNEIDQDLLSRAKQALGATTIRGTAEEALRRAAQTAERAQTARAAGQRDYLARLPSHADATVLASEEMWR